MIGWYCGDGIVCFCKDPQ